MPLPLRLQRIIERNPILIRYGPAATLTIIFILFTMTSVVLTEVYLSSNFKTQVNMDNATLSGFKVSGSPGLVLLADMFSIDLDGQTFSVHWSLVGACGHQYTGSSNDICIQNQFVNNVALYLNGNASVDWNLTTPIGTFDPLMVQNPPPVTYIPGRKYFAYISLLAIDTDSNQSLPISGVIGYGSVIDWNGSSAFYPTTVGNETLYALALTLRRQRMVKAFAILLVVTNWVLSVTVLWMTVLVLFRAHVDDNLILISTAVLFALPQIRATMPDSPPFGAFIDIAGYFMNVCLVSICTSILLFSQLQYHYQPVVKTPVEFTRSQESTFLIE
ncbi:hypothetical protein DFJ58DRAFT_914256 [Suillus subalutaceus]|uniref:uncharacterized protein n=1 Tax=Suillus subalutaceus TaxID=48586 RepID=UPI001B865DBD|nr:uncharacterized protein DFJ58DRAFT_914256 [Suillus subalutaceus]KAG1853161.1 hypothetical protein DFJ58DRAFT_914256 [Suillus subalutaceus]